MTPKTPEELAASKVTSTTGAKSLDVNDFLKLLAVQMNSQDPLNPTQNTEFVSQMANFTSLQQMNNLSSTMSNFATQQTALTAQNYLGKNVTVLDPDQGGSISGIVSGITITNGAPMIIVNGKSYDPASVKAVTQAAASSSGSSSSSSDSGSSSSAAASSSSPASTPTAVPTAVPQGADGSIPVPNF